VTPPLPLVIVALLAGIILGRTVPALGAVLLLALFIYGVFVAFDIGGAAQKADARRRDRTKVLNLPPPDDTLKNMRLLGPLLVAGSLFGAVLAINEVL
jgi:hypothetical protein